MCEQMNYVLNIDTYILQNSHEKITDIFMTKHKEAVIEHCGSDMQHFQFCFEAALHSIGAWQMQVDAGTSNNEEDEVLRFFSEFRTDDAGKLAESLLQFSDVFNMSGADIIIYIS
ncbi:hypothetical protein R3P88_003786 [Salmonella enterica]|nr:hypothetical protein [Salmonella enterica]EJX7688620.1 hypothetical protein [Salmonella enterica]ELR2289706.1 hypothetical protein [Salmonella enterica]